MEVVVTNRSSACFQRPWKEEGKTQIFVVCSCQGSEERDTISGDNSEGVPPVPIPNTEVKPFSVDGTWLETARESRSSPDSNNTRQMASVFSVGKALQNEN